jgi:oxygen-dependent protoporphyrinogen oxidase
VIGHSKTVDVLVVGAGITGLTAAWAAARAGASVAVLDAAARPGGAIATDEIDGFLVERGPTTMMTTPVVDTVIDELGLRGDVVYADAAARRRYVVRDARPCAIPLSPPSLFTTSLLTWRGKARLFAEPFVRRRVDEGEETLASLVRRRFGTEVLDYLVDPFVSGIYAGDPEQLSARHTLRMLYELEQEHRSILVGALRSARARRGAGPRRMMSFRDGLARLATTLASTLGDGVHLSQRVTSLQPASFGWQVDSVGAHGLERRRAAHVVLTAPAHAFRAIAMPPALQDALGPTAVVPHASVTTVSLGFRRADIPHPLDGFGVLMPRVERLDALGVLFTSTVFPGRAPRDHALLTCFLPGTTEGRAILRARTALRLLGITAGPTMSCVTRWPTAIPQYGLHHQRALDACADAEANFRALTIAGSHRGGVAVGDCVANGLAAADRAVSRLPIESLAH